MILNLPGLAYMNPNIQNPGPLNKDQGVVLKQQLALILTWDGLVSGRLTFTVPVFTWIHQTQNLGWIYG
jgi:hypothetical protein